MWPILKIDARTQIEAAPDEQTEMRCRSANQSLITDVFALRPYFCTIQLQPIRTAMQCGAKLLRPSPLTGDIRSYALNPTAVGLLLQRIVLGARNGRRAVFGCWVRASSLRK